MKKFDFSFFSGILFSFYNVRREVTAYGCGWSSCFHFLINGPFLSFISDKRSISFVSFFINREWETSLCEVVVCEG